MRLGFCEVKVSGRLVDVVSHTLGSDAAMAAVVALHDPFSGRAEGAEDTDYDLCAVLGSRGYLYYHEPLCMAPSFLDGAE